VTKKSTRLRFRHLMVYWNGLQCTNYVPAGDERHLARLFAHQVRDGLPRRRLCLEHFEHLRLVFKRFKEEDLKLRLKKYFFGLQDMEYLSDTVHVDKIHVSTKKFEAVADLPTPTMEKEVCIFVQFCNLYAKFVHHFSDLTAPFTGLLQNPHPHKVTRTLSFVEAFETLMLRLISEPCVILPEVSFDAMLTVLRQWDCISHVARPTRRTSLVLCA
jgi:hypothetical protein